MAGAAGKGSLGREVFPSGLRGAPLSKRLVIVPWGCSSFYFVDNSENTAQTLQFHQGVETFSLSGPFSISPSLVSPIHTKLPFNTMPSALQGPPASACCPRCAPMICLLSHHQRTFPKRVFATLCVCVCVHLFALTAWAHKRSIQLVTSV